MPRIDMLLSDLIDEVKRAQIMYLSNNCSKELNVEN